MAASDPREQVGASFTASLKYLRRDPKYEQEKPFSCLIDLTDVPGAEQTNIVSDVVDNIIIRDGRTHAPGFDLDETGFQLINVGDHYRPTNFEDTEWLKQVYYPFIEDMVLRMLHAKDARVFEHQIRYRHPGFGKPFTRGALHYDPPINQVHVDATQAAGLARFEKTWPNFTPDLLKERLRIINIWRPLVDTIKEWPLALCDFRSVDLDKDLRASDVITRNYIGESFAVHYNSNHQWYSILDQKYNEGWMIKILDTKPGAAHTVIHTAIDVGGSKQARKSCEIRLMVVG